MLSIVIISHVIISIHALHEESDLSKSRHTALTLISIHALHEESDQPIMDDKHKQLLFQSTLSMRRATGASGAYAPFLTISIHALHEESDEDKSAWYLVKAYFNPRSP